MSLANLLGQAQPGVHHGQVHGPGGKEAAASASMKAPARIAWGSIAGLRSTNGPMGLRLRKLLFRLAPQAYRAPKSVSRVMRVRGAAGFTGSSLLTGGYDCLLEIVPISYKFSNHECSVNRWVLFSKFPVDGYNYVFFFFNHNEFAFNKL